MSRTSPSRRSKPLLTRIRPGSVPDAALAVSCVAFVAVIGLADWLTGPDVSLVILYVLPVIVVTWLGRVRLGVITAFAVTVVGAGMAVIDPGTTTGAVWLWNAAVPFAFYVLVVWLVAGQRALLETQERRAATDALTGTLTRRAFYERVEIELERARREDRPIAFVYLDVDGLKEVNDTVGHAAGDELLRRFVDLTTAAKRGADLFGRLGGDEFALLLVGTDLAEATRVADRVLDRLQHGPGSASSASIGVVSCPHAPRQLEGIVRLADQLMYLAKRAGGAVVRATEFDPHPDIDLRSSPSSTQPTSTSPRPGRRPPPGTPSGPPS
jgi:diguanylate cyclase (GGDEF)-like protein